MSTTATPTYVCEVCSAPLKFHGGPYKPRWCKNHENTARRVRAREYDRKKRRSCGVPCEGCQAYLLTPSEDGFCGFCQVELGLREAI